MMWPDRNASNDSYAQGIYLEAKDALGRQRSTADIEAVIGRLQTAVKLNPKLAAAHATLVEASLLLYQENHERHWLDVATNAAGQARSLNPNLAQSRMASARLAIHTGHSDDAVRQIKEVLESTPDSDEAWRILGRAYLTIGAMEESVHAGQQAVRSNGTEWRNHDLLASLLLASNRLREAEAEYQTVLKLNAGRADTYNNLGVIYLESGNPKRAVTLLEKALQTDPRPAYLSNLGTAYLASGQFRLAAVLFEKAISLQPKSSILRGNLAEAYRLSNQRIQAAEALDQAVQMARDELRVNPNNLPTKTMLALYYGRNENFAIAQKLEDELKASQPNDCEVMYVQSVLYLLQQRIGASLDALEKAFQLGFPPYPALDSPDWTVLREQARFRALERKYKVQAQ
jgi:Flp pilus assembly protein TadD